MLPAKCLRCGATSRDALCRPCVDYLVGYHPMWLDASLLPGPALVDTFPAPRAALLAIDGDVVLRESPRDGDMRNAVRILRLGESDAVPLSEGDADRVHALLREIRRSGLDESDRPLAAAVYATLAGAVWMPRSLADEYRVRAESLRPPGVAPATVPEEEPVAPPETGERELEEGLEDLETEAVAEKLEAEAPPPDEGTPPLPETEERPPDGPPVGPPAPPTPQVLAALEREKAELDRQRADLEAIRREVDAKRLEAERVTRTSEETVTEEAERLRRTLDEERRRMEKWVEQQGHALEAKESALAAKHEGVAVEERDRDLRAQEMRREVVAFLEDIPGIDEAVATVVAEALPDLKALRGADLKTLTQLKGVGEATARRIRQVVAPNETGEVKADLREEAQLLMEDGNYTGALQIYDTLLQERPEDVALWFDRAELLVLVDRPQEAIDCYTRVLDLDPDNRQARYERANLFFGLGRLPEALDALRETVRLDPSKAQDVVLKAEQMRRDGDPNDAALLFQAVLDGNPEYARAVLGLGDALLDLGDADAAEGLYTRALGKDPQNPRALFRKGRMLDRKGRWGAAIQLYNRAIALEWNYVEPWLGKGKILLGRGKPRDALECFDKAVQFNARSAAAWLGKAQAHLGLEEADVAETCVQRARELEPESEEVKAALAALEVGATAKGEEPLPGDFPAFIRAVEPRREEVSVLVQLAELALEGGDAEMALLRYTEALEKDPRSADVWVGKGVALQNLERYDEAIEAYDKALEFDPKHEEARRWKETAVRRAEGAR